MKMDKDKIKRANRYTLNVIKEFFIMVAIIGFIVFFLWLCYHLLVFLGFFGSIGLFIVIIMSIIWINGYYEL